MEDTLNLIQIFNYDNDQMLRILSDFEELNNIDLYPGQAIQCKLVLPEKMKYYQKRMKFNGLKVMYIGMVDIDY